MNLRGGMRASAAMNFGGGPASRQIDYKRCSAHEQTTARAIKQTSNKQTISVGALRTI